MRRWILIFLLIFLPLQATWAAAGSYCQHESGVDAQHFGHHEHRHQTKASDEGKTKTVKSAIAIDGDCDFCHPCCGALLVEAQIIPKIVATPSINGLRLNRILSAVLSPPDRPDWSRLV